MNKEFIPYEIALELKELGFDEPCFGYFKYEDEFYLEGSYKNSEHGFSISVPTFSQAFRWFREKYDLHYVIVKAKSWFYAINGCNTQEGFNTYEEAELACLRQLIEIAKEI